jgi:hypothetical protein
VAKEQKVEVKSRECLAYKVDKRLLEGNTKLINWDLVEKFNHRVITLEDQYAYNMNYTTGRVTKRLKA